jgi:chromosomal replication initiation ATPase DnaA
MENLNSKKRNFIRDIKRSIGIDDIFIFIEKSFNLTKLELLRKKNIKKHEVYYFRKVVFCLIYKYCRISMLEIGKIFGVGRTNISKQIKVMNKEEFNQIEMQFIDFIK